MSTGGNIGNLVFRKGLASMVNTKNFEIADPWTADSVIYAGSNKPDKIVLSCANWIGSGDSYEQANRSRSGILKRRNDIEIVPVGLGLQGSSKGGRNLIELGEHTIDLLNTLAQRSTSISVRCENTKAILNKYNITNVTVTGCPSNFISHKLDLELSYTSRLDYISSPDSLGKIRYILNEPPEGLDGVNLFYSLISDLQPFVVLQTPNAVASIRPDLFSGLNPIPKEGRLLGIKSLYFTSVDSWLEFAYSCDASFGHRVHANMIGLQAGVPSLLICHDLRTHGLAEFMQLPILNSEQLFRCDPTSLPIFLSEVFRDQYPGYIKRRKELAAVFKDFFIASGLETTCSFDEFCRKC